MNEQEIENNKPDGATHYTPNGTLFVRVGKSGFVETCRLGSNSWVEIPMKLEECYLKEL